MLPRIPASFPVPPQCLLPCQPRHSGTERRDVAHVQVAFPEASVGMDTWVPGCKGGQNCPSHGSIGLPYNPCNITPSQHHPPALACQNPFVALIPPLLSAQGYGFGVFFCFVLFLTETANVETSLSLEALHGHV